MISVSGVDLQSLASVRISRETTFPLSEMLRSVFNRQAFTKRWGHSGIGQEVLIGGMMSKDIVEMAVYDILSLSYRQ